MAGKAVELGLCWDVAVPASVEAQASREWILTAMQKHGSSLVTMLWRILGNEQDVCDAYQETFLNLAHLYQNEGREEAARPANVKAYLFRSASNIAVSMLRRKRTFEKTCQGIASQCSEGQQVDYAHDLDMKHLQASLRGHLGRLPEYLRQVIVLRDLAEMPYAQVAQTLGISVSAARVYRWRAVQLLAVWMSEPKGR